MDSFRRNFWSSPGRGPPPEGATSPTSGDTQNPPTVRLHESSDEDVSDQENGVNRASDAISIRAHPTSEDGIGDVGSPRSTVGSDRSYEDALEREANSSQVSYGSAGGGPFTPVGSYSAPSAVPSESGFSSSQYGFLVEGAMHRLNQLADKSEGDTSLLQDCDESEFQDRIARIAEENGVSIESPSISSLVETLLPVVQEISRQTTPATTPGQATPAVQAADEGAVSIGGTTTAGAAGAAMTSTVGSPSVRLSVLNAEQPSATGLRVVTEDTNPAVVSATTIRGVATPTLVATSTPKPQPEEEDSGDYVEVDNEGVAESDAEEGAGEDEEFQDETQDEEVVVEGVDAEEETAEEEVSAKREEVEDEAKDEEVVVKGGIAAQDDAEEEPVVIEEFVESAPVIVKSASTTPSSASTKVESASVVKETGPVVVEETVESAPVVVEETVERAPVAVETVESAPVTTYRTVRAWDEDIDAEESKAADEQVKVAVVEAPAPVVEVSEPEEEKAQVQVQAPVARVEEPEVEKRIQQQEEQEAPRAPVSEEQEEDEEEFHEGEEGLEGEEGEEGEYEEYEEGDEYEEAEEDEDIDGAFAQLAASGQLSPEILRAIQQAQQQAAQAAAAQSGQSSGPQAPAGMGSGGFGLGPRAGPTSSGSGPGPAGMGGGPAGMGGGPAGMGGRPAGMGSGPAGMGSGPAGMGGGPAGLGGAPAGMGGGPAGMGGGPAGLGSGGAGLGAAAGGSGSGGAGLGGGGAGLGPALPPRPAAAAARAAPTRVEAAPAQDDDADLSDEQREVKAKAYALQVKLCRLSLRAGANFRSALVAQVLYRITMSQQRQMGRGMLNSTAMNFDKIGAAAQELETKEGSDSPLGLHIKMLFLGKSGVGKSATINNVFKQPLQSANAFEQETKDVRVFDINMCGIKFTVIDTPGLGLGEGAEDANDKKMEKVEKVCDRLKPDVVFYVDRLDNQGREFQDMGVINAITRALGEEVWFNSILVFTHAAVGPPDGSNGQPVIYDAYTSQRASAVQNSIRTAVDDDRLASPVCLVENHPQCRTNRAGDKVLPNGVAWRTTLLLLAFGSKVLNEANELLKLQADAQMMQQEDDRFANMFPLLTALMAESRALRTPKVWVSEAEKEQMKQHEALRLRVIDLERQIYTIEKQLAKEKEEEDVLDFENKLAPVYMERAKKEDYLIQIKTTLDLERTRLERNPFSEESLRRVRREAEEEERIFAERKRKVKYANKISRRRPRKLGLGEGRGGTAFWDEDEGLGQASLDARFNNMFAIWPEAAEAPYDRGGFEIAPLEWDLLRVPPLLDDRLILEVDGKIHKEPKVLHTACNVGYTYHISPVLNVRGDVDVDWMHNEGTTIMFTADTSRTDTEMPPTAGIAMFTGKRKGAAGMKLSKIFVLKTLRHKGDPLLTKELRLSTVAGFMRSFDGEVARGVNIGMSTVNPITRQKGRHKLSFNASDFRGDFGFGVAAESEGYKVAGITLGVHATADSTASGSLALQFNAEKKIWPAALMLVTGLKVLLQRWAQPGPQMEMGEY